MTRSSGAASPGPTWYDDDQSVTQSESETIRDFSFDDDISSIYSGSSSTISTLSRAASDDMLNDVTDSSFTSFTFGTLPRVTRKLFRSEIQLNRSTGNLNKIDKDKATFNLPHNWQDDDMFDPGMFGLLENPGVLRMEFDDYPDTCYNRDTEETIRNLPGEQDVPGVNRTSMKKVNTLEQYFSNYNFLIHPEFFNF